MNANAIQLDPQRDVLPDKERYFQALQEAPALAWPTMALFALSVGIIAVASRMTLSGAWPLWVATLANGIAMYTLFSVAHDGSHRAISRYQWLNELIGRVAIMMLLPIAPFEGVRWLHMQHHRYTNSPKDPDSFVHHIPWYRMPLQFAMIDASYLVYFIRHGGEHFRRSRQPVMIYSLVFFGLIATLTALGYGWQVFFLWFLASRLGLMLIAYVFSYLPHSPGNVTAQQNVYRASTIRRGWEWLLTPVLVYQNYHLMHHLFPTAPFYNYLKLWHLKYDEFAQQHPAVQEAFAIRLSDAHR